MTDERPGKALQNAQRALQRLQTFLAEPVQSDRDRAGIIQACEFTLETTWKLMQKVVDAQGLPAPSPRKATAVGYRLGFCLSEPVLPAMLDDRDATSHAYNESEAQRIFKRLRDVYAHALVVAIRAVAKAHEATP